MTDTTVLTRTILVEDEFPHPPALLWRAMTDGSLIGKWLMAPTGFAAVVGTDFTFQTKPAGAWDGMIRCRVLQVEPCQTLAYTWTSGDAGNTGYGAALDTVVTMTLSPTPTGTRLRVEHAGFELPRNEVAHQNMSGGWVTVVGRLGAVLPEARNG
jgi:uncharacterized protein YndB with AHSA1/START domain